MAATTKQYQKLLDENKELHIRLAQAELTLDAIRNGQVDTLFVSGAGQVQIYAAEESGRLYRVMLETMPEGAAALTMDGLILYANQRLAEMLCSPLEKVQGAWLSQFLNPTDAMRFRHMLEQEPGANRQLEATLLLPGGRRLPVHLTSSIARVHDTNTVVLVVSDQSEHRQLEQALRDSEALYRTLVESSEASIAVMDKNGVFLFANSELAGNLGRSPEDIAGMRMEDFLPSEAASRHLERVRSVLDSHQGQVYESISLVKGTPRLYRTSIQPILGASGRAVLALIHGVDVTEFRLAKEEVAASAARYQSLFENTPVALVELKATAIQSLVDELRSQGVTQGRTYTEAHPEFLVQSLEMIQVEDVNRAAEDLFGVESKPELTNRWRKLIDPENQEFLQMCLEAMLEQRQSLAFETSMRTMTGENKVVMARLQFEQRGPEYYVLAALSDITARKQAEQVLQKLSRAQQMINDCSSVLVHTQDEEQLLNEICRLIVESGGYRMAWVGMAENDPEKSVRPVAVCGYDDGYVAAAKISWADNERGRGPTGSAVREGKIQVNRNFATNPKMAPWRVGALKRGYQSSLTLPLRNNATIFGALTMYSSVPDAFDEDETRLLSQLADDLAFGLTALRERQALARAQEASRKWEHIFQNARWGVVVGSADGQTLELMNPEFASMHGYTVDELTGRSIRDLFPPAEWGNLAKSMQMSHDKGHFVYETMHLRKDGSTFPVVLDITAVKDENGQVQYRVVNAWDITERTQGESALRDREVKLSTLFKILPVGVSIIDNQRQLLEMNPALEKILKISYEGLRAGQHTLRKNLREDGTPMPPEEIPSSIAINEQREVQDVTLGVVIEDGSLVWVNVSAAPLEGGGAVLVTSDITARKNAEARTQLQANLLNNVSDAIISTDMQLNVTSWNGAAEKLYGWREEETLGKLLTPFIQNEYLGTSREGVTLAVQQDGQWKGEVIQHRRDGSLIYSLSTVSLVKDLSGAATGFIAVNRDISERKRMEIALQQANQTLEEKVAERTAELRESEQRFKLALKNAPVTVAAQDQDLRFIWAYNQRTQDPAEVIGKVDSDIFPPETAALLVPLKRRVLESGEELRQQLWVASGGRRLFLDLFIEPMRDELGRITGIGLTTVDLTPFKAAEEAMNESERRFRLIAEHTPDHLLVQDLDLRYLMVINPQLGMSEADMLGKTDYDLLPPGEAEKLTRIKRQVLETGEPVHLVMPVASREGQQATFDGSYHPRYDSNQHIDGLIGYFRDVTIQKQLEESLLQSQAELEQRVKERTAALEKLNQELKQAALARQQTKELLQYQASLLENVSEAVYSADMDFIVRTWNKAAEKLYGYTAQEMIGQNCRQVLQTRIQGSEQDAYRQLERDSFWKREVLQTRKDGVTIRVDGSVTLLKDASGKPVGMVTINRPSEA